MSKQPTFIRTCIEGLSSVHRLVCVLLTVTLSHVSLGELFRFQANAPIQGFQSPFFNENGEKTWQCSGEQVRYVSESEIHLKKMCITIFCPHRFEQPYRALRDDADRKT